MPPKLLGEGSGFGLGEGRCCGAHAEATQEREEEEEEEAQGYIRPVWGSEICLVWGPGRGLVWLCFFGEVSQVAVGFFCFFCALDEHKKSF
jgi:hypothetical protein